MFYHMNWPSTVLHFAWAPIIINSEVLHSEIRQKIRNAGARSKMHTKIRRVCSEKAHFAENIFRMHFLVEER